MTSTQIRRLWVSVGHHVHGIAMEFEDGSQFGEMLYDDGTLMPLPASQEQLALRATEYLFIRGEYITKVRSVKSTLTKFPLHAVVFTLHNGAVIAYNGTNTDEDAHMVCDQEASPLPVYDENGTVTGHRGRQIAGITFVDQGGVFTAKFGSAPWTPKRMRTTHLRPDDWPMLTPADA